MPDPRKRPGTIKNICEFTGLDRHQVAALLKRTAMVAADGRYEPFKTTAKFDSTARNPHWLG